MIEYSCEELTPELAAEIAELIDEHQEEVGYFDDIPLDLQWGSYFALQAAGIYRFFIAREEGAVVGYVGFVVSKHLMYGTLQAINDTIFLSKKHRDGMAGARFIAFADKQLEAEGVDAIGYHVEVRKDFSPLLKRKGYEAASTSYIRRL